MVASGIEKVATDIARGYLNGAADRKHGMGKVLADAGFFIQHFVGVGSDVGGLGIVFVAFEYRLHNREADLKNIFALILDIDALPPSLGAEFHKSTVEQVLVAEGESVALAKLLCADAVR